MATALLYVLGVTFFFSLDVFLGVLFCFVISVIFSSFCSCFRFRLFLFCQFFLLFSCAFSVPPPPYVF